MKARFLFTLGLLAFSLCVSFERTALGVNYTATRHQSIQLQPGWNAVYLEVSPTNSDPASVFAGLPVEVVATLLRSESSVQFIQDPATIGWKKEGWGVWYAPSRQDSFLSTLSAVTGNRAYLVRALRPCSLELTGYVLLEARRWTPNAFNFVGFTVDPQSPPTFEKFFRGSKAHNHFRIYRLQNDRWTLVTNPQAIPMRTGEAFWIHCRGGSDYQGPLRVKLPAGMHLTFLEAEESRLVFSNESQDPGTIVVEQVDSSVPLAQVTRSLGDEKVEDIEEALPAHQPVATLEPSGKLAFRLRVQREAMTLPMQSGLLKVSNGAGAIVWVPVVAHRADLATSAALQNQ